MEYINQSMMNNNNNKHSAKNGVLDQVSTSSTKADNLLHKNEFDSDTEEDESYETASESERRFKLRPRNSNINSGHNKNKRPNHSNGDSSTKRAKRTKEEEANARISNGESNQTNKLIIYNANDFLAIRSESANSFYLGRAKQNIYRNGRKIKIQWYSNDANPELYCPDFYDFIDFECILTNVRIIRHERGEVSLPSNEKTRTLTILERAINVEKGIKERPDPRNVLSEGLDISIIGKVNEADVLSQFKNHTHKNDQLVVNRRKCPLNNNSKQKVVNGSKINEPNQIDRTDSSNKDITIQDDSINKDLTNNANANNANTNNTNTNNDSIHKKSKPSPTERKSGKGISSKRKEMKEDISAIVPIIPDPIKCEPPFQQSPVIQVTTPPPPPPPPTTTTTTTIVNDNKEIGPKEMMLDTRRKAVPFISSMANLRLLISAVLQGEYQFIKNFNPNPPEEQIRKISSIKIPRSVSIKLNAIHYAIIKQDLRAFQLLHSIEQNLHKSNSSDANLMCYSTELYHSELMMDHHHHHQPNANNESFLDESYVKFAIKQNCTIDFIESLVPFWTYSSFASNMLTVFKCGNYELALALTQKLAQSKSEWATYNKILNGHLSLENDRQLWQCCLDSESQLYAIHLAAINPDPKLFSMLINMSSNQLYLSDREQWLPIHYASVCGTFFNLQYLLDLGVSTRFSDRKGNSTLHLATKRNRINNVMLILRYEPTSVANSSLLNTYNNKGFTPLHIACQKGLAQLVCLMLNNSNVLVDLATSNQAGELTPLMIAAKYGHLSIVEILLEAGASINIYDKKNRNALTYAVINGHSDIVAYLLNKKSNPSTKDIFGNNLFHYALAYGCHSSFELLLNTNICLKHTNTFGLTPIYAAFLKGHMGFIELILKKNILNVNIPVNDTGINLVMLTICSITPSASSINYLKLFIDKFKCDLSKTDYEGNNAMHHLLICEAKHKNSDYSVISAIESSIRILVEEGCDIYNNNHSEMCPITYSLSNQCFLSFSTFFKDNHKYIRFQDVISNSEHLWPMIISNVHREISINNQPSTIFGRYIINITEQDKNLKMVLKNLAFKTNISGDLPIEYFIKISTRLLSQESKNTNTRTVENNLVTFFNFLLYFYELEFLEDMELLHLAAKYSLVCIVERLVYLMPKCLEARNQLNHTPLMTALLNHNIDVAQMLISTVKKADIDNIRLNNEPCIFYYLKKTHSLKLIPSLVTSMANAHYIHQTDNLGNTPLHLICLNVEREAFLESVKMFIKDGINVNARNHMNQTALHIAFQSNECSPQLIQLWHILVENNIDPMTKDTNGYNAFNYLFAEKPNNRSSPIQLLQRINTFDASFWQTLVDDNQANLLHYSAKWGLADCVSYLLCYIDPNIPDADNHTALSLAIMNAHRECLCILLKSDKIRILENMQIFGKRNVKINLLWHIWKNDWKDAFFIIEEKAVRQNELTELIQILIKSECLQYALDLMKSARNESAEMNGLYVQLFAKYTTAHVDATVQREFLRFFRMETINRVFGELFASAFSNWNHHLCMLLIDLYGIQKILLKLKEKNIDIISDGFKRLIFESNLPDEMRNLFEMIIKHEQDINILSSYPIIEKNNSIVRYSYLYEHLQQPNHKYSSIKYTPLIVAIMSKNHSVVKWLLNIQVNKKWVVDRNLGDSQGRTPLMHAVLNNDFRIIGLLFDMEVDQQDICNLSLAKHNSKSPPVRLLQRDSNNLTAFHYLICPFEFGNYLNGHVIYCFLWNLLINKDWMEKPESELISELDRYAKEKKAFNIMKRSRIDEARLKNTSLGDNQRNINNDSVVSKQTSVFYADYESFLLNTMSHSTVDRIEYKNNSNIVTDPASHIPFDVTFTKLDAQDNSKQYVYNYYKVQLLNYGTKYCLLIRWGRVATQGNVKKFFYDSLDEAVKNFQDIFTSKSGENWTQVNLFDIQQQQEQQQQQQQQQDKMGPVCLDGKRSNCETTLQKLSSSSYKSAFHPEFRNIIIRYTSLLKWVESEQEYSYEELNTKSLERCSFILSRLASLITYNNSDRIRNEKENLKLLNDMIDLSEQFYGYIKIFGNQFDQLKPILSLQELLLKFHLVRKLKSITFGLEYMYFLSHNSKITNPFDYMSSSFKWKSWQSASSKEELDFIHSYLSYGLGHPTNKQVNILKMNGDECQLRCDDGSNVYLLWYQLKSYEFFHWIINGFEKQAFLLKSSNNAQQMINGIPLTNRIRNGSDSDSFILCEVSIQNALQIDQKISCNTSNNDANEDLVFRNKDCVIISESSSNCHLPNYFYWKGYVVPMNGAIEEDDSISGPNQFIYLSTNILPRYLVEFKQKSTN